MNSVKKIERSGERIYITILDGVQDSTFIVRLWAPKGISNEDLRKSVNGNIYIGAEYFDSPCHFDDRGVIHKEVLEPMFHYFNFKGFKDVEITGEYDSKHRFPFKLTEAGKNAYVVYLNHNIAWVLEQCSTICGNQKEAYDLLLNEQLFSKSPIQLGPDVKVVNIERKGDYIGENKWLQEILFENKDIFETEFLWSLDSLAALLIFKELEQDEIEAFVELGLIEILPECPWRAYKNLAKVKEFEYLKRGITS